MARDCIIHNLPALATFIPVQFSEKKNLFGYRESDDTRVHKCMSLSIVPLNIVVCAWLGCR